jgi:methionine synthase I (cobalamin-dependent)/5,10-methylenetetrahydrofolate reductase
MDELGQQLLIGSGAMGTVLRRATSRAGEPVELLNLRQPDAVRAVHSAYHEAGSQILVTNTFAANRLLLAESDAADKVVSINSAGVGLAREAAAGKCMVWASVGPLRLGLRLADFADDALLEVYREQCAALGDADALLLETFSDPREARLALQAATATGMPVVFQIGNTGGGPKRWERVDALLDLSNRPGVVAVGVNCRHPDEIVAVTSHIAGRTLLPLTASPNAGNPQIDRGMVAYVYTPEDFISTAEQLVAMGVAVVGGCCGTTPDHIRRLGAIFSGRPVIARKGVPATMADTAKAVVSTEATANPIRNLMRSDRFLVSVEIRADRMQSMDQILAGAAKVSSAGADLFDVPDNPGATVGRDAMVTAARIQQTTGTPSFNHLSVTQSNLMRLHSTLLGCWDLGLRGFLAVTGDVPSMGHLGSLAHRVTDLKSSVELLRLNRQLRGGSIINGEGLADPPDFCAGCAMGRVTTGQVNWLKMKIEAGAEFAFSQPVFTFEDYERLRDAVAGLNIRFFPGLMPLVSRRNAEFLAGGRIPGIAVPPEVVAGFAKHESAEAQRRFGLESAVALACRIVRQARSLYIIMPFGKRCYDETAEVVRAAKASVRR